MLLRMWQRTHTHPRRRHTSFYAHFVSTRTQWNHNLPPRAHICKSFSPHPAHTDLRAPTVVCTFFCSNTHSTQHKLGNAQSRIALRAQTHTHTHTRRHEINNVSCLPLVVLSKWCCCHWLVDIARWCAFYMFLDSKIQLISRLFLTCIDAGQL